MIELIFSYAVGLFIPLFDLIDLLVKVLLRRKVSHIEQNKHASPASVKMENGKAVRYSKPYKVLVSVRNIEGEFDVFKQNLGYFGYENMLVIDDLSTDHTVALLQKEHIPFITNELNLQKPASISRGLKHLPPEVQTVVVIDPDARLLNLNPAEFQKTVSDFNEVLADFENSEYDACAVRVLVECGSFIEKLQNFEYKITMGVSKKSLRHFAALSGAIAFYKRDCLEAVLEEHSKSVYGEDYETSLRLHSVCGKAYYDGRLTVLTRQRTTLKELTKQRMGWDLSLLKNHVQLFKKLNKMPRSFLYFYQYVLYNTVYLILFHPVRILSGLIVCFSFINLLDNVSGLHMMPEHVLNSTYLFAAFYCFSLLYAGLALLASERRRRRRYILLMFVYPFYGLYLAVVPKTLGYLNYLSLVIFRRKIIEDGYVHTVQKEPV